MAEQRTERRLAAILAGDVAGYSRLMGGRRRGHPDASQHAPARISGRRPPHGVRRRDRSLGDWGRTSRALPTIKWTLAGAAEATEAVSLFQRRRSRQEAAVARDVAYWMWLTDGETRRMAEISLRFLGH